MQVLELDPQEIAKKSLPSSTLHIAAVCLSDAAEMLCEARFALVEASIYRFVLEQAGDSDFSPLLFSAQFYLDDSVLRVYASAESVAAFGNAFLDKTSLDQAREMISKSAQQAKSEFLKLYKMVRYEADCPPKLAGKLIEMGGAAETKLVANYRNDWMHNQRWRMKGTGISWDRRPRWQKRVREDGKTTWRLPIRKGDPPKVTIEQAVTNVRVAYRLLWEVIVECNDALRSELVSNTRCLLRTGLKLK